MEDCNKSLQLINSDYDFPIYHNIMFIQNKLLVINSIVVDNR